MNKAKVVSVEEVPEVRDFMIVKERIDSLREMYPGIFEELQELGEQYNTLLQAADRAVREKQISCGPFDLYQFSTYYNANALFDAVGRDQFLAMGGSIQTINQYDIDRKKFDGMAAQGKIPEELVNKVRSEGPKYHKPKELALP